jgi:hypothetical protein
MGNIYNDIVDDINLKPTKSKILLKWVLRIAVFLIGVAFVLGQIKIKQLNKVSNIEKSLQENTKATIELRQEMNNGFKAVDSRINKIYVDGNKAFNDWTMFSKEQLKMIIDYGQSNKEMLKRMLDLNMNEKSKVIENQLEESKTTSKDSFNIIVKQIKPIDSIAKIKK